MVDERFRMFHCGGVFFLPGGQDHLDHRQVRCLGLVLNRVTFYRYPKERWRHLRTTNVVELPFAALRLRTDAAKRFKKVEADRNVGGWCRG